MKGKTDWKKYRKGKTYEEIYGEEKAKEIKKKIGIKSKGRKHTEEWKKIMNKKMKGRKRPDLMGNKNRLGKSNKWGHHSESSKQKIRLSLKGHLVSKETRQKQSEITKRLIKQGKIIVPSRKGISHTKEVKEKIGLSLRGEKNRFWKGDDAGYITLHIWLRKYKPKPKFCEECREEKRLTLANIKDHHYTRNPEDYRWLCYSCHKKFDIKNRRKNEKRK